MVCHKHFSNYPEDILASDNIGSTKYTFDGVT